MPLLCISVEVCICGLMYVCMYGGMYVGIYVCMHVRMRVCQYVYACSYDERFVGAWLQRIPSACVDGVQRMLARQRVYCFFNAVTGSVTHVTVKAHLHGTKLPM